MSVHVTVSPSHPFFFSGELFSVNVTFTNSQRPNRHSQKSHSISSAQIARPPTSPHTPIRSPAATASHVPQNLDRPRPKGYLSTTQPQSPYPLLRSPHLNMSSKHPHARKQSVLDGSSPSSSTYSLLLDPIAEHAPPAPSAPPSPIPKHVRTPTGLGLGLGLPSVQPSVQLILYSYIQLVGTAHFIQCPHLDPLRATLLTRPARGGGSMDITTIHEHHHLRRQRSASHRRSTSLSASLLSLLSPPTTPAQPDSIPPQIDPNPDAPLPTFQVQPTLLAVDLPLRPGESRSFAYALTLPPNLPPTFRGRSMRFSYELILGTCRAGAGPSITSTGVSQVMKVPIRIYNHVPVGRPPEPYDLMWPLERHISDPVIRALDSESVGASSESMPGMGEGSLKDVQGYARRLLDSGVCIDDDDDGPIGCREGVDLLTRNLKKVSYDVNKDGVRVAVLTLTKSAYRLGETVLGVIEVNDRTGLGRVLKLSARLETEEKVPGKSTTGARKVHAEHHSSVLLSTMRTTFALDIPSDATPGFRVCLGGDDGGIAWKVKICFMVGMASPRAESGTEGVRMRGMVRDGQRGRWGTSWHATEWMAPMECVRNGRGKQQQQQQQSQQSWMAYLTSSLLGLEDASEPEVDHKEAEYDGVRGGEDGGVGVGVNYEGAELGWQDVSVETVECEVPIRVWAGNTVFKAVDVEFDV